MCWQCHAIRVHQLGYEYIWQIRYNDVATSLWRNNDVIASRVCWGSKIKLITASIVDHTHANRDQSNIRITRKNHDYVGLLHVKFVFSSRKFYREVPGFATDCPCDVSCPPFGNLDLNNNWFVSLTWQKTFFIIFAAILYTHFTYISIGWNVSVHYYYHYHHYHLPYLHVSNSGILSTCTLVLSFSIDVVLILSMEYGVQGFGWNALGPHWLRYRKISNIRRTLAGNNIVDHSDVVGASPVGAAPTTSSFSTW